MSVIISSFNQGQLIVEAVQSVRRQTRLAERVIVVDDGSTDVASLVVLEGLELSGHCEVVRQTNQGVSAARNTGIAMVGDEFVVVLDGDDTLAPEFVERTAALLDGDPNILAASSWMRTHGVFQAVVKPGGGRADDFLHRNACPAAVLMRRSVWEQCGGYEETMRDGFEDWDFFLSLLADGGRIGIIREPLINYRTAAASSNVRSMDSRLALFGQLIDRHRRLYDNNLRRTLLAQEARLIDANNRWEEVLQRQPTEPLGEVTYGDGGMAAAVRISTDRQRHSDR